MSKRVLQILGWGAALLLVLGVGAAVGGGIVYATTRAGEEGIVVTVPEELDPEPGIVVASVVPDGSAAEAGVVRGDILLEIDAEAVDSVADLVRALGEHEVGDQVTLKVLHGDEERTLAATLGDHDGKPYLGLVPCAPMPEPGLVTRAIHVAEPGAVIIDVVPDSPADQAGLEAGDVIVAVDGQEIGLEDSLTDLIAEHEPGEKVTLEVKGHHEDGEDGESREVAVELAEHPDEEGVAYLGVRYRPSSPARILKGEVLPFDWDYEWRPRWRHAEPFLGGELPHIVPEEGVIQGAIIRTVDEDSPAETAGLRIGDVITGIDGEQLEGPRDLVDALAEHEPGDQVTLTVYRPSDQDDEEGEEHEFEVTLAEHAEEEDKAYLGVRIGGFVHVRGIHRGDGERLEEFDLEFDWEAPLDELPFEFEVPPQHFEFHFPPGPFGTDEVNCCTEGV